MRPEPARCRAHSASARHNGWRGRRLQQTVDAVWRMEAAKIVATLTRAVGDVGLAEDLAQEALVDALEQWPATGVPRNAGAWLTTVAKRKAIDQWRRQDRLDAKYAALARELETHVDEALGSRPHRRRRAAADLHLRAPGAVARGPDRVDAARRRRPDHRGDRAGVPGADGDDRGHASPGPRRRSATRACRSRCRTASEYPQRLSAVLSVIYLIYNEGYSASFGPALDPRRIVHARHCVWAECWPRWYPTRPRCTGWWR